MGVTPLDDFGVQVLFALFESERRLAQYNEIESCDEQVWESGQALFGSDWGGDKKYSHRLDHHYYSVVAMKLGQLVKLGYVSKVPMDFTFVGWRMTNKGKRLLHEHGMFGDDDCSSSDE